MIHTELNMASGEWELLVTDSTDEGVYDVVGRVKLEGTARRIVACVNACEGIHVTTLESLEGGGIDRVMRALRHTISGILQP